MQRNDQYVSAWLSLVATLIISIVILGGYTRLSGSGLSIVEWSPISGIVPPISHDDWILEFDKYKQFPEYRDVNHGISLPDFKFIFMVEFLHRILGRIIGLAFVLPLIYFCAKKYILLQDLPKYFLMLGILCLQGFMGWYMVKSGLAKDPHVSHYRLSMHLIIAIILYSLIVWQIMPRSATNDSSSYRLKALLLLVFVQTFFGGMVAGLKAGLLYNTFPLMGIEFVPYELEITNLSNPVSVQFIHRILAYLVLFISIYLSWGFYKKAKLKNALILLLPCFAQVLLGIITLIYYVPIYFALLHQFFAIVLITAIIYLIKIGGGQEFAK